MRAFSMRNVDYYILKKDIGEFKAGAIFWHNKVDTSCGNFSDGSLVLCRALDGDCYGMYGENSIKFNALFKNDASLFEKVVSPYCFLKPGKYEFEVTSDGYVVEFYRKGDLYEKEMIMDG